MRIQRRRLAAVWLAAGSALAAMVGAAWCFVAVNGHAPGGDMIGHAAAAEWLRTLPWWDWRGWSDWFYGGQAIGVNYPPLGHAWMRFTDPVHGQMAAVAIGLVLLLPWGSLRLARAVGYSPQRQRTAVAAALLMAALAGQMHWVLSGFHVNSTFFGSWPAMLATVIGLFAAADAANHRRPVAAGAVLGIAGLFNSTVIPGVMVVCVALLATSGISFAKGLRWALTAASAAVAVSAWWLVPFVSGWDRLVRWEVPLLGALAAGGTWQSAVLAVVGVTAAWAARVGAGPARRLALAALAGLGATLLADLFGYLRPERWLQMPILLAALAASGLLNDGRQAPLRRVRPVWVLLGAAFLIVFAVLTVRIEVLPLAGWLVLRRPLRDWVWSGVLSWVAVLLLASPLSLLALAERSDAWPQTPLEAVVAQSQPDDAGLVYVEALQTVGLANAPDCKYSDTWQTTILTGGRIRHLLGLYRETSATAEFLDAGSNLLHGEWTPSRPTRSNWFAAWDAAGRPQVDTPQAARALGARWYVSCDRDGNFSITQLPAEPVQGATVDLHHSEEAWHRAATSWWVSLASSAGVASPGGHTRVPVLADETPADGAFSVDRAASGIQLHQDREAITVIAEQAGWVWIRVPWDPDWRSVDGLPVHKGGPGHLVVWAEQGVTELRWEVPGAVDAAAAGITGLALLATAGLSIANRRRGWDSDPGRSRPAAHAVSVFADTVDGWARTVARHLHRLLGRYG